MAGGALACVAAVVAATAVGMTAVGAIGSGIVQSGPQPLDAAEVDRRLAAAPPPAAPPPAAPAPAAPPSAASAGPAGPPEAATVIPTAGGTVIAGCTGELVQVVSATPAQGWQLSDLEQSGDHPSIRFTSGRELVEVRLRCRGGAAPEIEIRND